MIFTDTLHYFAFGALVYLGVKTLNIIKRIFYPYVISCPIDLKKAAGAEWAVITGSTDGIGKEYAIQLAMKGFNIILIARNPTKLENVKNEIYEITEDIRIETIVYDFTNGSFDDYEMELFNKLKDYEIGIFVNNVGLAIEYPEILHKTEGGVQRIRDILVVNTLPATILTGQVIPQMLTRNKGIIINVASYSGCNETSEWSVYAASKRYVMHLTKILQKEYSNTGLIIQCLIPLIVVTKMSKAQSPSIFSPYPTDYVKSALKTIGKADQTTGCLGHQLQAELINLIPSFLLDFIFKYHNRYLKTYMKNSSSTES